jgi:hypothetical protein
MRTTIKTDEMLPEYDFSKGVRGKHFKAYQENTNVILLEDDVAKIFKTSESVNHALRMLINIAEQEIRNV